MAKNTAPTHGHERAIAGDGLEDLVEALPHPILVADLAGKIVHVNGAMERLAGHQRDKLLGHSIHTLIPARYRSDHILDVEPYFLNADARSVDGAFELHILRSDGTEMPVDLGLSRLNARGRPLLLTTVRQQSVELRETLRLKEMNEFRSRFINMAAHELKTPLTPIRIQSRLLATVLAKGLSPEQQRAITSLDRNVDRLQRLVDDILDAARVQATQLRLRKEVIDLTEVVGESVESYRPVAHAVGVGIDWRRDTELPVEGDRQRLLQVVNNLLNNSIKFTTKGGLVRLEAYAEGARVMLRISDTGRGMVAEQIQRLFQPFTQVHGDTESTKGTGLGLFICKGIVEEHGGTIEASSDGPNRGSAFVVSLPLAPGKPVPRSATRPKSRVLEERIRELI